MIAAFHAFITSPLFVPVTLIAVMIITAAYFLYTERKGR